MRIECKIGRRLVADVSVNEMTMAQSTNLRTNRQVSNSLRHLTKLSKTWCYTSPMQTRGDGGGHRMLQGRLVLKYKNEDEDAAVPNGRGLLT